MSLITTTTYHDIKLINYINNLSELNINININLKGELIGIYYNKDDLKQIEIYNNIKKYYNEIIIIDVSSTLEDFKLIICLDDTNFDLIEQCYNLNILLVSNYQSNDNETNFINQFCIRYKNEKSIYNIINIVNSTDTFAIIIPVYNSEKYIEKTILSVLCQTYRNYVIYIIDDCSTDNSLEIAKKYSHLPNVIITSNDTNLGKFMSINKILPNIKTKYYLIVDSDDIIIKNRLIYDMIEFTKYKSILVVNSKWYRYNETTNLLISEPFCGANNSTFKTEIINKIGLYWNTRFGGDSEYIDRFYKFIGKRYITYLSFITCIAIHRSDKNNLTLQIPLRSKKRLDFRNLYIKYHNDVYNNMEEHNSNICINEIFNKMILS